MRPIAHALLASVAFLLACLLGPDAGVVIAQAEEGYVLVKGEGLEGVIFPACAGFTLDGTTATYWTPTKEEVLRAESRIPAFLKAKAPRLTRPLARYKRQYVGLVVGGKKRVLCNFFLTSPPQWQRRPVVVEDGGEAFFHLEYDLESDQCLNLQINGEA